MKFQNLKMPPLNTTLLGVLRGVADYYDIKISDAMLFGGSGHAFLINIHEDLCPSSPFCWNPDKFKLLTGNLGIEITNHGFFTRQSDGIERSSIELFLREHLDMGVPCSLLNLEHQLITGYDDSGFFTFQPWAPHVFFPPDRLTFGSWLEFGDEVHVSFFTYRKINPVRELESIIESLKFAVDLYRHPHTYTEKPYAAGPDAYTNWIEAVKNGHGSSHGNWWNASVWSECRVKGSDYFAEIALKFPQHKAELTWLSEKFRDISLALGKISDKSMDFKEKIKILEQTKNVEADCIEKIVFLKSRLE